MEGEKEGSQEDKGEGKKGRKLVRRTGGRKGAERYKGKKEEREGNVSFFSYSFKNCLSAPLLG